MMFPAFWKEAWTAALVNHLWQSTGITLIAWLLAVSLRRNQARTRYWMWMIASLKFLVPFSLLVAAGESLRSMLAAPIQRPALAVAMEQITEPFPQTTSTATVDYVSATSFAATHHHNLLPLMLIAVWLCGFLLVAISWSRSWWKIRAAVRASSQMTLVAAVPVLSTPRLLEPGVFGILRPALLLPENITDRLSTEQLRTIIAHEMCHVRRRDNLTAAIHMFVKAAFWFHPAVWWIENRLLEERERACDEAVLQSGNEAQLYAESILSICKFYVEGPVACMSGVTGSDLKRRIVRIMTEQVAHKLDFSRKLLLGMAGAAALAVPVFFGLVHITQVRAQSAAANAEQGLAGTWQGTLHAGKDLRIVFKITPGDTGGYQAVSYSIDQEGAKIPVKETTLQGATVKMSIPAVQGSFEGKLSQDGKTIVGTLTQGSPLPLTLIRATPETEWAIPEPPPPVPPMDANASPSFEVATIKPSKPDEQRKAIIVDRNGRHFQVINQDLIAMISFSYGVQAKQVIGLPPWAETEKYDIDAQPDGEGAPSDKQWKGMLQKLLADRFKFTIHRDKKELSVYVLSVAKGGPKLTKSDGDPNGLPGLFFRGRPGLLNVRNANMDDFVGLMQAVVLDRPVIDQTGLAGRWNFTLDWTPDDSQFGGMAAKIPPPTDNTNPPPALYTAIQEQIGLKLDATKAPAEVLVVDHVEKPSEN
jgi:uncharacterized protein (TIGR03435 family)